ncbi:C40 family peptidase [Neobacillus massiliamazoniensis]|uniref:NLP/P60 protein n=1 Tax=Neobacillus massiliamazoniensis TaxID=1499688 RepID=A0A0U1NQJ7_9BACI|nr:C40 family peptidase [Neobacillus massiliamazoniensis]CRK80255.1 NLP/P60 protein [Neobacillus massiliamazoniensis]
MKKKSLKYSVVAVAVLSTVMQTTPSFASPIDSKISQTQGAISQTQGQINDLETKIQKLDNQIIIGMDKAQKLNDEIKKQQGQIDKTKVEIDKAQKDFDIRKDYYFSRLRSLQSQQSTLSTYAEVLLSSNNISEFFTRSFAVTQILQSDSDLMSELNKKEQALKDAKEQLNTELDNLKKTQNELASEQKNIEANKQEIEQALAQSKNTLQQQQGQLAQQQDQQKAEQLAIEKAQEQARQLAQQQAEELARQKAQQQQQAQQPTSGNSTSKPPTGGNNNNNNNNNTSSATASQVIAIAKQYLGVPYVWGGTSPSGFDCSGLMGYVYRQVGINLPRVAQDQQNVGKRISPYDVQPGDLVFNGEPAYHVVMYIGNGQIIQAPQTGDVVKISPYNPANFTSASRVLK